MWKASNFLKCEQISHHVQNFRFANVPPEFWPWPGFCCNALDGVGNVLRKSNKNSNCYIRGLKHVDRE